MVKKVSKLAESYAKLMFFSDILQHVVSIYFRKNYYLCKK
jgi:hypothetical protein